MAANLSSKTYASAMAVFDDTNVVIDRASTDATNPVLTDRTVIYSGACDFQSGGGSQYRNPSGVVDIADAWLAIDPATSGVLPAVEVGDRATVTQTVNGIAQSAVTYNVDNVTVLTAILPHVELLLKRGPLRNALR